MVWAVKKEYEPHVVILECSAIPDIEYSALMVLIEAEGKMARNGVELWLVGLNPETFQRIHASPLGQTLGDQRMFPNLHQAVRFYRDQVSEREKTARHLVTGPSASKLVELCRRFRVSGFQIREFIKHACFV